MRFLTYPAEHSRTSRCVGVEDSHHRTDRGVERGSAVEPKPPEPDQNRTQENQCRVVRLPAALVLGVLPALAEDEGVRKGGPARGNVNWTTASEIERGELVRRPC